MPYRKIKIANVEYQYIIGRTHTKVRGLNAISNNRIGQYVWQKRRNWCQDDYEYALRLRVTPKNIVNFIKRSDAGDMFLDTINPPKGFDIGKIYQRDDVPPIAR